MKKTKILFVHGGTLKKAGTETFMMSVFRNIDAHRFHIDFLVFGEEPGDYDNEVLSSGSKIFRFPLNVKGFLNPQNLKTLKQSILAESYDIVHAHMNALNYPVLTYFKKLGIKTLISHSHGSKHFVENKLLIRVKDAMMRKIPNVTTYLLACSKAAGDFLYEKNPYVIINNGVDTKEYVYNPNVRSLVRAQLNVEDFYVYGHIGRFNFQKNHEFLIETFKQLHLLDPSSHLILIGDGELKQDILNQIKKFDLEKAVTLLGVRNDIPNLLQAMDGFIMPSVFEGLPYVLVEAQASGLQCFAADTIDSQSKILDSFHFLPLDCPKTWAKTILERRDLTRSDTQSTLIDKGFDVYANVKSLETYYEKTKTSI